MAAQGSVTRWSNRLQSLRAKHTFHEDKKVIQQATMCRFLSRLGLARNPHQKNISVASRMQLSLEHEKVHFKWEQLTLEQSEAYNFSRFQRKLLSQTLATQEQGHQHELNNDRVKKNKLAHKRSSCTGNDFPDFTKTNRSVTRYITAKPLASKPYKFAISEEAPNPQTNSQSHSQFFFSQKSYQNRSVKVQRVLPECEAAG
jgi:cell division protein FtsL